MSTFREKAQGRTKQMVGQMIGDEKLVEEGREQEREAEQQANPSQAKPSQAKASAAPSQAKSSDDRSGTPRGIERDTQKPLAHSPGRTKRRSSRGSDQP